MTVAASVRDAGGTRPASAVDLRPAVGGPGDLVEQRAPRRGRPLARAVGVVEHEEVPGGVADRRGVTGAAPRAVGAQDRVGGVALPRAEQAARARDAERVAAV